MRVLLGIIAFVLILPVLLVIGIMAGPAGLVLLFLLGCALVVLTFERVHERYARRRYPA